MCISEEIYTKMLSFLLGKGTAIAIEKTEEENSETSKGEQAFIFCAFWLLWTADIQILPKIRVLFKLMVEFHVTLLFSFVVY